MDRFLRALHDPVAILGSAGVLIGAYVTYVLGQRLIRSRIHDFREQYRRRQILNTLLAVGVVIAILILWARLLPNTSTFLGLIGAGLAIALCDPLLSVAARLSIFFGHIYTGGDRIEINHMTGDVIDVGFFYTRLMEIGNWIGGDMVTGRTVQFSNSAIYGGPIFNYTQYFPYIWDELRLPVTFDTNLKMASEILLQTGQEYTRNFLKDAGEQLEQMRAYFLVPSVELEPTVFMKVTSNWVELALRYVVDPKQRRNASNFIFREVFERIRRRDDIAVASETMDLTVHPPTKPVENGGDEARGVH
jgi:small-conductance mechanosensitive channel